MTATVDIESLLKWSAPREVSTKRGPRLLRKARPDEGFWLAWAGSKAELQAAGISIAKDLEMGAWTALWWQELSQEVLEQRAENLADSRATDAEIEIPAPEGCEYLPFQKAGIRFALGKEGCLIGDEQGLGKTIMAIGVVNATPEIHRVLVITKASLKMNWWRECRKWLVRDMSVGIVDGDCFPSTDVAIINFDLLHKYPGKLSFYWDLVVVDEFQNCKNRKTRRARALIGYRPSKKEIARGEVPTSGIPARRRLALSGTPMENRPEELWTALNFLDPKTWGSFWGYAVKFCGAHRDGFGFKTDGASNLDLLQRTLRSTCFTGDTEVYSQYGKVRISEIVSRRLHINVWSADSLGRLSLKPVIGWSKTAYHGPLVKVRFATGSIICTPDHRIFTESGQKRACEIEEGDYLLSMPETELKGHRKMELADILEGQQDFLLNKLRWKASSRTETQAIHGSVVHQTEMASKNMSAMRETLHGEERTRLQEAEILHVCVSREMDLRTQRHLREVAGTRGNSQTCTKTGWMLLSNSGADRGEACNDAWSSKSKSVSSTQGQSYAGKPAEELFYKPEGPLAENEGNRNCSTPKASLGIHSRKSCATTDQGAYGISESPWTQSRFVGHADYIRVQDSIRRHLASWQYDYRSGRSYSHDSITTRGRQETGQRIERTRVLCVESVELGYSGESCSSASSHTSVYDIEVEGNHNFIANGILVHNCMIRRLKRDVLKELPPKTRMLIELQADGAGAAIRAEHETWQRHEAELARMQAEVELAKVSDNEAAFKEAVERFRRESTVAFTEIAKVRHETALVKLDACIAVIKEDMDDMGPDGKCLIFAHHRDVLAKLHAAFGSESVLVTGETPLPDRDKAVQRFQNDPGCRQFIGSSRATGEGLNLQAANLVFFVEMDWNPSKLAQCEDRSHRYGQRDNVLVKYLLLADSLDARMMGTIVDKMKIIDAALDEEKAEVMAEPVLFPKAPVNGTRKKLDEDGMLITEAMKKAILTGLRMLSGVCDGALKLDGQGFNRIDVAVGHSLAEQNWLSPRQAALGRKICRRYVRQLGEDLIRSMGT